MDDMARCAKRLDEACRFFVDNVVAMRPDGYPEAEVPAYLAPRGSRGEVEGWLRRAVGAGFVALDYDAGGAIRAMRAAGGGGPA
jgi:hypothetical protein